MKSTRKTHFVPRVVFRTAFAGVVPVCVAATACGGSTPSGGGSEAADAAPDQFVLGVACSSFECMGVGVMAFADASDDATAHDAAIFSVACFAFDGGPCGLRSPGDATTGSEDGAAHDASDIHDATADVPIFAVAAPAFADR
jgi:hypothetical protein